MLLALYIENIYKILRQLDVQLDVNVGILFMTWNSGNKYLSKNY